MPLHIDAPPAKDNAFHLQAESLLGCVFAAQFDRAARAEHPMPGQPVNLLQDAHDLARRARPSRRAGNATVSCHRAPWQGAYAFDDAGTFSFYFRWLRLHETIILLFGWIGKDKSSKDRAWLLENEFCS